MDVQTENTDPPPNESQPSGKIRKGFKLFGKRKPGNIFSIRNKGDGNNKSPVIKSKALGGLSETPAPDSEQEADREKGQEVSQGEMEHAEDEALGEDGILAAAPARTSICSVSSAKSLGFLSLLRGGRRGVGDRRVHTVSQPVGRQRRGLKGLFGNVKLRSKDKEDKEEPPPSPLLMSSRANSVEIIKEDLTLTPKCQPRSLESPETQSSEPIQSSITHDSAATSPSESTPPHVPVSNVSKAKHLGPTLPSSEPPLVPGENSLSNLLADISSLLTFDSISGGGDIMADVEAEWGKSSSRAVSPVVTDVTPSSISIVTKPTISSSPESSAFSSVAAAKPSYVSISSTITKPSTAVTSSTFSSHSVKPSFDSTPTFDLSARTKVTLSSATTTTKPFAIPVTLPSSSAPVMSTFSKSNQSTISSITSSAPVMSSSSNPTQLPFSAVFTAATPVSIPASTTVKAPSITSSSPASKLAPEITLPSQNVSVSKPSSVASLPPSSAKPPVTHSPPILATTSQPVILDSVSSQQKPASYKPSQSLAPVESKPPVSVAVTCAVTTKPSSYDSSSSYKTTSTPVFTTTSGLLSSTFPKPSISPITATVNNIPPSLKTVSDKVQPSDSSISTPNSTLDTIPSITKPTAPVLLDKMPNSVATTCAVSASSLTPAAVGQINVSPASANVKVSPSNDLTAPTKMEVSLSKSPPILAPADVTKVPPAPVKMQLTSPEPSTATQVVVSVTRDQTTKQAIPSKDPPGASEPPAPSKTPVSLSLDAPAQIPTSALKNPPAPSTIPVTTFKATPPAQIQVCLPKVHPASLTDSSPSLSPPSPSALLLSEAPITMKMKGNGHTMDNELASPSAVSGQGSQAVSSKAKESATDSHVGLQGSSKEKKPPPAKASGLSKIPVVGGGRVGKIPVRDSQNSNDEPGRDPPTPELEERPHFNSHDTSRKDKISTMEANVPTSKHTQEESQMPQQPKISTSSARDSKIPVKHGAQSHAGSQMAHTKEPSRTKIPVSKVPVRKAGNKPGSTGIRK